jgi:hypothetical protein
MHVGKENAKAFLLLNGKRVLVQLILDLINRVWLECGEIKLLGGYRENADRRGASTERIGLIRAGVGF